jgi:formamidopyrimidine-DNA glycosylase
MPELPEVESITRVCSIFKNATIQEIEFLNPKIRFHLQDTLLYLQDPSIEEITRRGKYMIWKLAKGALVFHFGMSGTLSFRSEPKKHDHIFFMIDDKPVFYNDPRRFGMVWFTEDLTEFLFKRRLGIEPFDSNFNGTYLQKYAALRTVSIKSFLFNQSIIAGLGNIYINEALFKARINPFRKVNAITIEEWNKLSKMIQEVLTLAINAGGSTLQDYNDPHGCVGYFKLQHQVYQKYTCSYCYHPIIKIMQHQRATYYCPTCQAH